MLLLLIVLLVSGGLLLACSPQFGAVHGERTLQSDNFRDGKFRNLKPLGSVSSSGELLKATADYFTGDQYRTPKGQLPTVSVSAEQLGHSEELQVTWLGHSSCLIEIDGRVILTDPVFAERASPFSLIGPKRFASELPIQAEQLPRIDAVLISHDHYDHLAYRSILALHAKVDKFYVPLGVGGHLERWGVPIHKIVELDWWEQRRNGSLQMVFTPAQHFSGRGLRSNKTLWGSWVIKGEKEKVFFSGDSGYFDGFKEIGDKYGPFDITLLENGAYNTAWANIHMLPEETLQAHIDLRGKLLLPIHWGKFNLSLHAWTEPVERLLATASRAGVMVSTPLQGEPVSVSRPSQQYWWTEIE